ncbi:MAG: protein kinase domain-containing protein [Planctomycetota bacterium]|jgi:predicted Ser/Thr protein kinase/Flp pilus assembly protein TadD
MPGEYDLLFGRVAVELGYLTQETLEASLEGVNREPRTRRLGVLLVEKSLLSAGQFREITAAVSARMGASGEAWDELFARLCIKRKFALAYQVRRALSQRRSIVREGGEPPTVEELLVSERVITPEQARQVNEDRGNFLLCPACRTLLDVHSEAPGTEIGCRRCDQLLRVSSGTRARRGSERKVRPEGHRVGNFQLVREIGKGSTGVVYEARDLSTGGPVALKILPEAVDLDREAGERFRREAEIVSKSDHPSIVPILDVGEEEGAFFIVMEYVEGETLDTLAGESPFSVAISVETALQVAKGLQYAHDRGIIHRDVKPANILLDRTGRPRILDFGLAKRRDVATITASGTVLGTPMYMSPEQATVSARVDHRTDVYSLGASLYEILTGVPPFVGTDVQSLIRQVRLADPPSLRSIRPDIPRSLENVVMKAMAKDMRKRYATAAEFADDLGRFLEGNGVRARPPGPWERGRKFIVRHREKLVLAFLAIALVMGGWMLWELRSPAGEGGRGDGDREVGAAEAMESAAFNAYRLGHHAEAVDLYTKLLDMAPPDADILLFRALALRALGRESAALIDLDDALVLDPKLARARYERGSLHLRSGRFLISARDFRVYVDEKPGATEALVLLGSALTNGGRLREAKEVLQRALVSDPGHLEGRLLLAEVLVESEPEEASGRLEILSTEHPDLPRVHYLLGRALERAGAFGEALRAYQEEVRKRGMSDETRKGIERVREAIDGRGERGGG